MKESTQRALEAKQEADRAWAKAFLNEVIWRAPEKLPSGYKLRGEFNIKEYPSSFRVQDEAKKAIRMFLPEHTRALIGAFDPSNSTRDMGVLEMSGLTEKDLSAFAKEVNFPGSEKFKSAALGAA